MKRFVNILLIFIFIFLSGCSKSQTISSFDIEKAVAYNLEQYDKDKNLDDETLKTLSVIIRTNLEINSQNQSQNMNPSEKYINISNQTKDEILLIDEKTHFIDISENQDEWEKSITKEDILTFAHKNNISLSNISEVEPVYEEDMTKYIKIGGKLFNFENFANEFDLISNKINNISTSNQSITINGKGVGFVKNFDIKTIKTLSNNGFGYKDIINNFYPNSKIIK